MSEQKLQEEVDLLRIQVLEKRDVTRSLRTQVKTMREALVLLIEESTNMRDQYGCDCGHPFCKPCKDTESISIAIEQAERAVKDTGGE